MSFRMFARHTNLRFLIVASCQKANCEPFIKNFGNFNQPRQHRNRFISNQNTYLLQVSNKGKTIFYFTQCMNVFLCNQKCSVNAKYLFVIPIGNMAGNREGKSVQQWVDDCITSQPVVVFSKTYCPFCDMAKVGI